MSPRHLVRVTCGALLGAVLAAAASAGGVDSLVQRYSADELAAPLRRFETQAERPRDGAEAAMLLGRLFYARGEYRAAADAFLRAAARLDPARKDEARYWAGLSWLALGQDPQARAILEEVAASRSARRLEAKLGVALAWEQGRRPDRALDVLEPLVEREWGEAMPGVLERTILLAERFHRSDLAGRARARLLREFPRSIEAARARQPAGTGAVIASVEVGPFSTEALALAASGRARGSGFPSAHVASTGSGSSRRFVLRVGEYLTEQEAEEAAGRLRKLLSQPARVVVTP